MRALVSSVVLKAWAGVEVAAESRLIMIVNLPGDGFYLGLWGSRLLKRLYSSGLTINARATTESARLQDVTEEILRLRRMKAAWQRCLTLHTSYPQKRQT